jgi:hypothetical protein
MLYHPTFNWSSYHLLIVAMDYYLNKQASYFKAYGFRIGAYGKEFISQPKYADEFDEFEGDYRKCSRNLNCALAEFTEKHKKEIAEFEKKQDAKKAYVLQSKEDSKRKVVLVKDTSSPNDITASINNLKEFIELQSRIVPKEMNNQQTIVFAPPTTFAPPTFAPPTTTFAPPTTTFAPPAPPSIQLEKINNIRLKLETAKEIVRQLEDELEVALSQ